MSVKALFYIQSVSKTAAAGGASHGLSVTMFPVTRAAQGEEHGNIQWSKYTPSGKIEMTITDEGAQDWFEDRLGQDVPITFGE